MDFTFKRSILLLFSATVLASCSSNIADKTDFPGFAQAYLMEDPSSLDDGLDLYVDYSTCVAMAMQSPYYRATHPSIVNSDPVYYSIKGSVITRETDNRQQVYNLLNNVTEVNYAEIKQAVDNIVNSNRQAVLITDGEYFLKGLSNDNLNNPYLASAFEKWVLQGHEVWFYCEPYLENGKYDKYRYYILFTDSDIKDNIHDKFERSAPKSNNDVTVFHLNNGMPSLYEEKGVKYPKVNEALSAQIYKDAAVNLVEFGVGWKDIQSFLNNGDVEQDYILRGLYVVNSESDSYKIKKIKPVVYQLNDEYEEYSAALATETAIKDNIAPRRLEVSPFAVDEDIFEETGEIVLKLAEDFDRHSHLDANLNSPNLLRVDFVVEEAEDNFSNNPDINSSFTWSSISSASGYNPNTSMYESVSLVVKDPKVNPEKTHLVVSTIFINSYSAK